MNSEELYQYVPSTICNVFDHVVKIFRGNWKPLVLLTAYCLGAYLASFLLLILAAFLIGAEEAVLLKNMQDIIKNRSGGGQRRYLLLDYALGTNGVTRFLDNTYYYYYDYEDMYYDEGSMSEIINSGIFGVTSIVIYLLWIVVISLVSSVFGGAIVHAVAEIYAGNVPIAQNSLERGWATKWTVFGYNVLFGLSIFLTMLLTIVLPVVLEFKHIQHLDKEGDGFEIFFVAIMAICLFVIMSTILSAFLVAAVPSIICERKSTIGAFQRSVRLCKSHACFIIGSYVTYHLLLSFATLLINLLLSIFPSALSSIGHLTFALVTTTVGPM